MSAPAFEKTNFDWQLQQFWQRFNEWLELRLFNLGEQLEVPGWAPPAWVLSLVFWLIVSSFAGWLGWQLFHWWRSYRRRGNSQVERSPNQPIVTQEIQTTAQFWLRRAQEWQQQGNYREACRSLYMAMLHQLHDSQLIPAEASRTDGEYLTLIQRLPNSHPYQTLIDTHEQICFGDAVISADVFQRCQQAYHHIAGTEPNIRSGGRN